MKFPILWRLLPCIGLILASEKKDDKEVPPDEIIYYKKSEIPPSDYYYKPNPEDEPLDFSYVKDEPVSATTNAPSAEYGAPPEPSPEYGAPPPAHGAPPSPGYAAPSPAYGAPPSTGYGAPTPKPQKGIPFCESNFVDSDFVVLCIPNIVTSCEFETVKLKRAVPTVKCVDLTTPVCGIEAEDDQESNFCIIEYFKKKSTVPIQFPAVKYSKRCDVTDYQTVCKKHVVVDKDGYFKEETSCTDVPLKTCLNKPTVRI